MMTLVIGILDFYQLVDLRPLRQLDPVVNFSGQQRLQATFGHSGWFAEYVVMSMAYLGTVLIAVRRVRLGIALVIGLLMVTQVGLILTYQRGGWISHVFPLLTIWLSIFFVYSGYSGQTFRDLIRRSLPKVALAVPATIGVALIVFLAIVSLGWFGTQWRLGASSYAERFGALFDTSNRSMYISTGLKLGRLHPVLGAGSESFAYTYMSEYLRPGGAFYGQGDPLPVLYGSAHNIYLQTLTGKGLVGLALLLAILGYVVIGGIRILLRQPELPKPTVLVLLATIGSTLGVACYGVVQEVFYIQSIQYLIFATFGIAGSLAEPWLHLRTRTVRWLVAALAVLFLVHLAFEYGYPGRMRDRWFWQQAVREGTVLGITELDSRGTRFRWSGARAYLDLPCSAKSITVPVRSLSNVPQNVEILVNGRMIDRVALVDHNWRELKYPLPRSPWYMRSNCVELRVDPTWHPPGDTRQLGVMVGMYSSAQ
jgi:O-antigen ligase